VDQLLHPWRDPRLLRARRELPAGARCAVRGADRLRLITCRHESGAANMAEAYGKLTGTPGICFVTRGPGATHASVAVHTAFQDSTPMILFIGQVGTEFIEREAFQEIDYRACSVPSQSGSRRSTAPNAFRSSSRVLIRPPPRGAWARSCWRFRRTCCSQKRFAMDARRWQRVEAAPPVPEMERFSQLLRDARRPIVIVGGSGWTDAAYEDLRRFAETQAVPVACAFRYQHLFDNTHASYAGMLVSG